MFVEGTTLQTNTLTSREKMGAGKLSWLLLPEIGLNRTAGAETRSSPETSLPYTFSSSVFESCADFHLHQPRYIIRAGATLPMYTLPSNAVSARCSGAQDALESMIAIAQSTKGPKPLAGFADLTMMNQAPHHALNVRPNTVHVLG